MKIRLRQDKRKGTVSISFRAEGDREGVALKNAVLAAGIHQMDSGLPVRITEELAKNGVDKADFDVRIVAPVTETKPC